MTNSALIGHTGFVGSTLLRAGDFQFGFNSRNSRDIRGRSFDLVVCAGVPAVKWIANKEPAKDKAAIAELMETLAAVEAREFILISTIDVYPDTRAPLDETASLDSASHHPYGAHRLEFERWIAKQFSNSRIVRLPALFGEGLKKNALYDLMHGHETEKINPASVFQWYPLRRLTRDIKTIRNANLQLVNLFPEPVPTSDIVAAFFPGANVGPHSEPASTYRLKTRYSELFGGREGYVLDQTTVLGELASFIAHDRNGR